MEALENVITLKPAKKRGEKPDSTEKSHREANAGAIEPAKTYREAPTSAETEHYELESALFVDLLANENGKKAALSVIKSDTGRRAIVTAITTNGLDKTKAVAGITALMRQYQSGEVIRMRQLCDDAAATTSGTLSRDFLERSIVPMLVELGVIIRAGERSAYWQPHHLIGKKANLLDHCKRLFELTPAQRELKQIADQLYAEQKKLNALTQREMTLQQQKAAYMRITTQSTQLTEMAAQHPAAPAGIVQTAKAHPGATLMIATLVAGVFMAALGNAPQTINDAPLPALTAAMQTPEPTPDTAAVAALETAQIQQQMQQMENAQ